MVRHLARGIVGAMRNVNRSVRAVASVAATGHMVKKAYSSMSRTPAVAPGAVVKVHQKQKRHRKRGARKKPNLAKKVHKMAKTVRHVSEQMRGVLTTHVDRGRVTSSLKSAVHLQNYNTFNSNTVTNIETMLGNLYYFNPATNAWVNASGAASTKDIDFLIEKTYGKIVCRNNYQVPCLVSIYRVEPKSDTSIAPHTAYDNGLADNISGALTGTSALLYPTDSDQFVDLWRISASKKKILEPGQELHDSYSCKPYRYNPSDVDSQTDTYQRRYHSTSWLVFVEGMLGHDTAVATEQTLLAAGIDIQYDLKYVVKYTGGQNATIRTVSDSSDASFTNGGVVSLQPVADNLAYSVS